MTTRVGTAEKIALVEIKKDIIYIKEDVTDIKHKLEGKYITQEEFKPIKSLVYGMVGLILTGVVGALLALIIKQ